MKILLFGSLGQLGQALSQALNDSHQLHLSLRADCDLTNTSQIEMQIDRVKPDLIINAAAYNNVDEAENNYDEAFVINAKAPEIMSKKASILNIPLIHFSTDYVFDGLKKDAYTETDTINPQSLYAKTKYLGEEAVRSHLIHHLIIRTSSLYGNGGINFVNTIIDKLKDNKSFDVVNDCSISPTPTSFVAKSITKILPFLKKENFGTYHLTTGGFTSPYDCATFIEKKIIEMGVIEILDFKRIHPIKSSQYKSDVKRPMHAHLDCTKIKNTFMLEFNSWQDELNYFLDESFPKGI